MTEQVTNLLIKWPSD